MPLRLILILILFAGIAGACKKNTLDEVKSFEAPDEPLESGRNIEIIYTDSAILKARIFTPLMEKYYKENADYLEMKEGVKANFYEKDGSVSSSLKANYAIRYVNKEVTELEGDVVVVNEKGDSLNTEHLIWDEKKEKIYSDRFVRVKTPTEIIHAEGFESDVNFNEYKFYDIKGTIQIEDGP